MSRAIYWLTNDLRLSDNLALEAALAQEPTLSFVFCLDPKAFKKNRFLCRSLGEKRYQFLLDCLLDIDQKLKLQEQYLNVYLHNPIDLFKFLNREHGVSRVYVSVQAGFDENETIRLIQRQCPGLTFYTFHTHTLYTEEILPCPISDLPNSFSKFRRLIESQQTPIPKPIASPTTLGKPFLKPFDWQSNMPPVNNKHIPFCGGETSGLEHLEAYFNRTYAQKYKDTRNALDDFDSSTKFSAWLAFGCFSPRQVMHYLKAHEKKHGANESTYWIFFELLWREYFQWLLHQQGKNIFLFQGIQSKKPKTSFYPERYKRWVCGTTAFPIVNACMKQLNKTGYMSNRGRQLVASCFINELGLDWRYGAAYFEEHLIDYDVASNWGNWQYLAGVGVDPRGQRHFNLIKQTQLYDPLGHFIKHWGGDEMCFSKDSVDASDWPIS